MTDKDIQRLKRTDLLELLLEQGKEMDVLREELKEAKKQLEDRRICLEKAGTIAEASFMLNGVFDAAQSAAQQYLENIQHLSANQERICEEMMNNTRAKCEAMEKETAEACKKMLDEAKAGADKQWEDISTRLENFYNAHQGLREILTLVGGIPGVDLNNNEELKEE